MKATKQISGHEYLGSSGGINLYCTEYTLFAHKTDLNAVMEVRIEKDSDLSIVIEVALLTQRLHLQTKTEMSAETEDILIPIMLTHMAKTDADWIKVSDPTEWLAGYLSSLVWYPEVNVHAWDSLDNYVAGFELYRAMVCKGGYKPSRLDELPSKPDLQAHYLKWVEQIRRH